MVCLGDDHGAGSNKEACPAPPEVRKAAAARHAPVNKWGPRHMLQKAKEKGEDFSVWEDLEAPEAAPPPEQHGPTPAASSTSLPAEVADVQMPPAAGGSTALVHAGAEAAPTGTN